MDPRLQHAQHLLSLSRFDEAAHALLDVLGDDPENGTALALLVFASIGMRRFAEAVEHGDRAVAAAPDELLSHLALGEALLRERDTKRAEGTAQDAIRLDPGDPGGHGLMARVQAARKEWSAALDAANRGLECDPEDDTCTNVRAFALRQLGRHAEAEQSMREQLRRTPGDSSAHANQGWNALHQGDHPTARAHLREALRLDPSNDWARDGLRESLKARHWFYRPILRYFLWIGGLKPGAQAAVLIGGYVGYRAAYRFAETDGPLRWLFVVLVIAYLAFVASTWFASPIACGLLTLTRDGRYVLSPRERAEALAICGLLATGIALVAWDYASQGRMTSLSLAGLVTALIAAPLNMAFSLEAAQARRLMLAFTGGCALLGAFWVWDEARVERIMAPFEIEAEAIEAHRQALNEEREALLARDATDAEAAELSARIEAFLRERAEFEDRAKDTRGGGLPLGLILVILCLWVSQPVAGRLAARYER